VLMESKPFVTIS